MNFSGTSLRGLSLTDGVAHVRTVAERYRSAAQQVGRRFVGAEVLEVGPGDNLGAALCLIGWGARRVVCLDRFDCLSEAHYEGAIYRALLETLEPPERARAESCCPWSRDSEHPITGAITYLPGCGLEDAHRALAANSFDCAVSNATLEHVRDVTAGVAALAAVLKTDAWMFHEVDLRCHRRFEKISPLHFLTISNTLWRLMGSRLGAPNRIRINTYRKAFSATGFAIREDVLEQTDAAIAERVFPSVDPAVRAADVADLQPLVVRFTLARGRAAAHG